jgi:hypothetical protein
MTDLLIADFVTSWRGRAMPRVKSHGRLQKTVRYMTAILAVPEEIEPQPKGKPNPCK